MTRESLQDEVKSIQQKLNKTIVFVSHDMGEALKLADVIIFMESGQVVQMASRRRCWSIQPMIWYVTSSASMLLTSRALHCGALHAHKRGLCQKGPGCTGMCERMARSSVDSLLVTDEHERYVGTISIGDIPPLGPELTSIEPLVRQAPGPPGWATRPRRALTTCWIPVPAMWWS